MKSLEKLLVDEFSTIRVHLFCSKLYHEERVERQKENVEFWKKEIEEIEEKEEELYEQLNGCQELLTSSLKKSKEVNELIQKMDEIKFKR